MELTCADYLQQPRAFTCVNKFSEKSYIVTIGAGSYMTKADIQCPGTRGHILIGNYSPIGRECTFLIGMNHDYRCVSNYPFRYETIAKEVMHTKEIWAANPYPFVNPNHYQIIIGNDVWIGHKVTIMGGVRIGNGSVIGANSTVTKDIPPYAIAVGSPARVIKYRFDPETIRKLDAIKWWNWSSEKIKENVTLLEKPKEFLEKFYSPGIEDIGEEDIDLDLDALKQDGKTIYAFVLDFSTLTPLWQRVVRGFVKAFHDKDNAVLLLFFEKSRLQKDVDALREYSDALREKYGNLPRIVAMPVITVRSIPYKRLFRKLDYFIASKEVISSYCIDCLSGTDVKVISALDDSLFPGEKENIPVAYTI